MHLWPSMRIRDSFKQSYLEKLEWNLHRMKSKKKQKHQSQSQSQSLASNRQRLLDDTENNQGDAVVVDSDNHAGGGAALFLYRELLSILSCCYGYFCCGDYLSTLRLPLPSASPSSGAHTSWQKKMCKMEPKKLWYRLPVLTMMKKKTESTAFGSDFYAHGICLYKIRL